MMFSSTEYPKSLEEDTFDQWLSDGRESKMSYSHLLIIWDEFESDYIPVYIMDRSDIGQYELYGQSRGREALVAVYDLYSEARISI